MIGAATRMTRLETLKAALEAHCGDRFTQLRIAGGEITGIVAPERLRETALLLRDTPALRFEQLMDLCGLDYSAYARVLDGEPERPSPAPQGTRFAVVYHLLSVTHNWRLRLRLFARDTELPVVDSVIDIWPSASWLEREAFDLFGIVFSGHPDLRRLLTDYGFIGHPFRKDFPISGNVEMRYDPDQKRVVYQPVTIEPREITPRIVREENYAQEPPRAPK
jgi:NADH-quinone oxidoreductase subunit C